MNYKAFNKDNIDYCYLQLLELLAYLTVKLMLSRVDI